MVIFFDLDHTLLRKSCGELYGRYLFKKGLLPLSEVVRITWWAISHRLNLFNAEEFVRRSSQWITGMSEAWITETCEACVREVIANHFYFYALEIIAEHRAQGHKMYILSAASDYIVRPIAEHLKLDGFMATNLESVDGVLTGKMTGPFCYAEGKLIKLRQFCESQYLDLSQCTYYGDSFSDVPVLAAVGRPVAVNPDRRLRREAIKKNWEILTF